MNEKHTRLLKDTVVFAIGNIGSKIILFFLVPLYTHYMTQAEYGVADLVYTASELIVPFVSLVVFDAMLRFGLSKDCRPEDVLLSSALVLAAGSVLTVALTPLFGLYPRLAPWKWYLCAYIVLTMLGHVEMNYLKVLDRNKTFAAISILQTLVLALANIALLTGAHMGVRGYLIAALCGSSTTVLLALVCGHIPAALRRARFDPKLLGQMLDFSAPLVLNNVSWWVIQSSDKFMVDLMVGAAALGLYTAASKIPSLINVIINIFTQAWGISSVREIESSNDLGFYAEVFHTFTVIAFGASLLINTVVKPFMGLYVSAEFRSSWQYVPLLLVGASFSAVALYFASLYSALKKSVRNTTTSLLAAAVNLIVNYIFILRFGVWGAVIGTVAAYVLLAFVRMLDVLHFLPFAPKWKTFLLNGALAITQAVLVSLDWHGGLVSLLVLIAFVGNNLPVLRIMLSGLKRTLRP